MVSLILIMWISTAVLIDTIKCLCKAIKEMTSKSFFHAKWWSKFDLLQLYPTENMKTKILTAQGKNGQGQGQTFCWSEAKNSDCMDFLKKCLTSIPHSCTYMLKWWVLVPFSIFEWICPKKSLIPIFMKSFMNQQNFEKAQYSYFLKFFSLKIFLSYTLLFMKLSYLSMVKITINVTSDCITKDDFVVVQVICLHIFLKEI